MLFHVIIAVLLAIDLGVSQRRAHAPSLREALAWSIVWIGSAVIFNVFVYFNVGGEAAINWGTAYVIEKSLSVDNLFVFAVIFRYFHVELKHQHRVLFWGILGAIVARAIFIVAGVALLETFSWMTYLFGGLLIYGGYRLLRTGEQPTDPSKNLLVRLVRRGLPLTPTLQGSHFFVRNSGKLIATPLFVCLLAVESTDIVFALDSVPAVLAITTVLFIAYTSNIFAILGLRALYFVVIQALLRLRYLSQGLAVLLTYLGVKFLIIAFGVHIQSYISLLVVAGILGVAIAASLLRPGNKVIPTPS